MKSVTFNHLFCKHPSQLLIRALKDYSDLMSTSVSVIRHQKNFRCKYLDCLFGFWNAAVLCNINTRLSADGYIYFSKRNCRGVLVGLVKLKQEATLETVREEPV
jgi:hypothetical protein